MYGIKTYSLHSDQDIVGIGAADMVGHEGLPGPLEEMDASRTVYFVKTHTLPVDDKPAIYIVRDGRDVLVSWTRYHEAFYLQTRLGRVKRWVRMYILGQDLFSRSLAAWIRDTSLTGGWGASVLAWLRRSNGRTVLLKYEDLVADPVGSMQRVIVELGVDIKPVSDKAPSFVELHAQWPQFFRKGKAGAWREEMTESNRVLFWEYHGEAMRLLRYAE